MAAIYPTKLDIRRLLADSHVGAVAVVWLMFFGVDCAFNALLDPVVEVMHFVIMAVAIVGVPSASYSLQELFIPLYYLHECIFCLAAAWVISKFTYGVGPFALLARYRKLITRRSP